MSLCCKAVSQEGAKAPDSIQTWALTLLCSLDNKEEATGGRPQGFTRPSPKQIAKTFF